MSQTVLILWTILLIVTVLLLPVIVSLLHRTWLTSRAIEYYFKEMLQAGLGVAGNTDHIKALDDTINVASGILEVAGEINNNAETIKTTLANRAASMN